MITLHRFGGTGEAYDACQCDDTIAPGDTLLIERESVVGLAGTWPVAVTVELGEFHCFADGVNPIAPTAGRDNYTEEMVRRAVWIATSRGWPIRPEFEPFK